ncbi:alanine--tRNA ligase [Euzebya sp.]|uniref:alanine--tRNA ligase n=1 Tax=Euzebya sp. TaxID=1971409 RepID=UPI003515BC67
MQTAQIRSSFLEFFRARDHRVLPSASLIPQDPTLLLTVAGMVPFKPYFLGEATPEHPRAATIQKVARTNDIENVGRTTRHLTFFEMLGNFSFGDYFKAEAIRWAYELSVTPASEGGLGFDPERLWATVYESDDEAEQLWLSETDIPAARIQRRDAKDNFWSTGGPGPCGPCTEIFYDRGPEHGAEGGPVVDETRYTEYWNLVFMQYETDGRGNPELKGSDSIVGTLPKQNVDTGSGLERVAMLLQDVPTLFDTDEFRPLVDLASELTSTPYTGQFGEGATPSDVWLRVIAEHARATAFLIGDGVLPANEGRGYVLRRLLRRVVNSARKLGLDDPIMPTMTGAVIDTYGDHYPDLKAQATLITKVAQAEEDTFAATLRSGLSMLDSAIETAKATEGSALDAQTAFTLHDTYGFPVDLTIEIAAEQGVTLDRDAFAEHMDAQRARARAATKAGREGVSTDVYKQAASAAGGVEFTGYERESDTSAVAALIAGGGLVDRAQEGDEVQVVLRRTPFYAEGGGQLGDHGVITTPTGRIQVTDTTTPAEGLIVHTGTVVAGEVATGEDAEAEIDHDRRTSIRRGHTATHILHATIREMLGDHAAQAGSAIDAGHFRFDFPHFEAISSDQLAELEGLVNDRIADNPEVQTRLMSQEEARSTGATALFGEKYGDTVRVVTIEEYSKELCGGTHVHSAGEVGLFTVLDEGSIANNVRRIQALTGPEAFGHLSKERLIAQSVARILKVPSEDVPARVEELMARVRDVEKQLARAREEAVLAQADQLLADAEAVGDARVVSGVIAGADHDALRTLALDLRNRIGRGAVVLGTMKADGKAQLLAALSADVVEAGTQAADVLRPGATVVGGGAGGTGDDAQAGGKDGSKVAEAVQVAAAEARSRLQA